MIRSFGTQAFGYGDIKTNYPMLFDPWFTQSYTVQQNLLSLKNAITGKYATVILEANSCPSISFQVKGLTAVGANFKITPGASILNFLGSSHNMNTLMVFIGGVKVIQSKISWNSPDNTILLTNPTILSKNDQVELFTLSSLNIDTTKTFYSQVKNKSGALRLSSLSLGSYVVLNQIYKNVMIFKNGLFCAPSVDYYISGASLFFTIPLVSTDVLEIYVLRPSGKQDRINTGSVINSRNFSMIDYPNLRFKGI